MAFQISGQNLKTGVPGPTIPQDQQGALIATELNPRYYLNTYAGNKYAASTAGGGVQLAATHLFSTAIATFTPILAIYNPLTNTKNAVILQAFCGLTAAPLATATQTGAFLFVVGSGQSITNAQSATPVNCSTLKAVGSSVIGITNAALAGGVGNPTLLRPMSADFEVVTATANATALAGSMSVEDIAGGIIIPPGGYLALANGISNAVAGHLVTAGFVWDEIAL